MIPARVVGTGRARGSHSAVARTALGTMALAGLEAAPLAQATSERLALTVAALIAVAVLAILGGLVVLLFRRQAGSEVPAGTAMEAEESGDAAWAAQHPNGSARYDDDEAGGAGDEDGRDAGATAEVHAPHTADEAGAAGEAGAAAGAGDHAAPEPVILPPDPAEAWTAEVVWAAHATRFRVVARRADEEDGPPVALAQTEVLPWPPTDQASVQALTDASRTLESVLLDSGWDGLEGGAAWYAKRFAWEPEHAGGDPDDRPGGRFARRDAVPRDADASRR
jgi:hypothetical protein